MKVVLIILIVSMIMLIARAVSEQIKERCDFYENLKMFLNQFKLNISFKQEKILDFLNNLKPKRQFKLFIDDYKEHIKGKELNLSNIKVLEGDDILELQDIVSKLGGMDAKNELEQLESFMSNTDVKLKKAQEDKQKLCPMITKLSLLFALALVIILL